MNDSSTHFSDSTSDYSDDDTEITESQDSLTLPPDCEFNQIYYDLINTHIKKYPNLLKKPIANFLQVFHAQLAHLNIKKLFELVQHIFGKNSDLHKSYHISSTTVNKILEKNKVHPFKKKFIVSFLIFSHQIDPHKTKKERIHDMCLVFNLIS